MFPNFLFSPADKCKYVTLKENNNTQNNETNVGVHVPDVNFKYIKTTILQSLQFFHGHVHANVKLKKPQIVSI